MKFLTFLAIAIVALTATGCNNTSDDGLDKTEVQAASRVDQIAKASGGDWNKISQADKDYLIKDVSMGSEQSAKMLIMSKSGALRASPGGKPANR